MLSCQIPTWHSDSQQFTCDPGAAPPQSFPAPDPGLVSRLVASVSGALKQGFCNHPGLVGAALASAAADTLLGPEIGLLTRAKWAAIGEQVGKDLAGEVCQ